jgi:hypothetical protein
MRYSWKSYWGLQIVGVALVFGGTFAVLFAMPPGVYWAKFLMFSIAVVAGVCVTLLAYRSADEVMLSEHKTAWFWGSMVALSLWGPLLLGIVWRLLPMPLMMHAVSKWAVLYRLPHPAGMPPPSEAQIYFIEGSIFVIIVQAAAFLVVLAYLRLRASRP